MSGLTDYWGDEFEDTMHEFVRTTDYRDFLFASRGLRMKRRRSPVNGRRVHASGMFLGMARDSAACSVPRGEARHATQSQAGLFVACHMAFPCEPDVSRRGARQFGYYSMRAVLLPAWCTKCHRRAPCHQVRDGASHGCAPPVSRYFRRGAQHLR